MQVDLFKYIEAEYQSAEREHAALEQLAQEECEQRLASLRADVAAKQEAVAAATKLRARLEALKRESQEVSIPFPDVERQLEVAIATEDRAKKALSETEAASGLVKQQAMPRESERLMLLRKLRVAAREYERSNRSLEARVVADLSEIEAEIVLPQQMVTREESEAEPTRDALVVSPDGKLRSIHLSFGWGSCIGVPIDAGTPRFPLRFRPQGLGWVPNLSQSNQTGQEQAYRGTAFIVESNSLKVWAISGEEIPPAAKGLIVPLVEALEQQLQSAGGALSLAAPIKTSSFLERLRTLVESECSKEPLFVPRGPERDKLEDVIEPVWNAVRNAGWNETLKGPLAKLKYLCEEKVRARAWFGKYEGQFGFRFRTKDHSWLVGTIFITPVSLGSPDAQFVRLQGDANWAIGQMGKVLVAVDEKRDKDDA